MIMRRYQEEHSSAIGINGFDGRNTRQDNLMEIYGYNNLRVNNTVYNQNNYTTYMSKGINKTPSMHGIFTIAQTAHKKTRDCKSVNDGAESDHADLYIKISITYIKLKHNTVTNIRTDWTKIETNEGYADSYCETIKYLVDEITSYDNLMIGF